jgi:geranylgeranyl pyrophosphate synthase
MLHCCKTPRIYQPIQRKSELIFPRLDDIQDNSPTRRGRPAGHVVFGTGQTINPATYMFAEALEKVLTLSKEAQSSFAS